jgi:hypothetical protein
MLEEIAEDLDAEATRLEADRLNDNSSLTKS